MNDPYAGIRDNDKCPCGSGKTYKKCHRRSREEQARVAKPSPSQQINNPNSRATLNFKNDELGYPGTYGQMRAVPVFPGDPPAPREFLEESSPRLFELTGFLSKGEIERTSSHFNFDSNPENGGSFILVAHAMEFQFPAGKFLISKNSKGEASMVTTSIPALNSRDAITLFNNTVSQILDVFSFENNIPIWMDRFICRDTKNGDSLLTYTVPYNKVEVRPGRSAIRPRLLPVFALYREAKNTGSVFYKFFCFGKILEGLLKKIRPETFRQLREKQISHEGLYGGEVVPEHPELHKGTADNIGKPIQQIFETHFQAKYRAAIAHFAKDDEDPLWLSDRKVWENYADQIFLLEICCKTLLESEIRIQELIEGQSS